MRRIPRAIPLLPVGVNLARAAYLDRRSASELQRIQSRRLHLLLRHAYTKVPYYRERWDASTVRRVRSAADLATLPVLERETVRDEPAERLLADGFTTANTHAAHTSGSSGTPRMLYYSEHEMGYLRAVYLSDLLAMGIRPRDSIAFIRFEPFRRHRLEALGILRNIHIDNRRSLPTQIDALLTSRPTVIAAFPSVILSIVEELERRGTPYHGAHTVIFGGERISTEARRYVLDQLRADGQEVYASVEAHTIARSCPKGALHLRTANVVVEVEHDDGTVSVADGVGDVIVTRLLAEAMPTIRYRLGDRVEIGPDDCRCGVLPAPVVHQVVGRTEDRLINRDGQRVYAQVMLAEVETVPSIRALQVQQRSPGRAEVHAVPAPGAPPDLGARIRKAVEVFTDQFDVTVHLEDDVLREPSGKVRLVKNLIPATG